MFNRAEQALAHLRPVLVTGRRRVNELNDAYRVLSCAANSYQGLLDATHGDGGDEARREQGKDGLEMAKTKTGFKSLAAIDAAYENVRHFVHEESDNCNKTLERITDDGRAPSGHGHVGGETRYDVSFNLLSALAAPQVADILSGRTPFPTDPKAVHDAWLELSADQQWYLLKGDPARFGNLNGVPAKDRDTANQLTLNNQLDALAAALKSLGMKPTTDPESLDSLVYYDSYKRGRLERASGMTMDEAKHALLLDTQLLRGSKTLGMAHLLAYESGAYGGKGRAAVAYGDVDSADNVAFCVPGLNSSLGNMDEVSGDALHLLDQSHKIDPQTAVVAWQGYDAPDLLNVAFQGKAEAGAKLLAADVNAMSITHDGPIKGKLTVVGHSYGSTTTGLALQREHMITDQAVFIGSPGIGGDAQTSADLGLDKSRVFVGSASRDIVTTITNSLGRDPSEDTFGATRFKAESVDRSWSNSVSDHSLYYDAGNQSESLYSLASIVTGHGDRLGQEGMLAESRHLRAALAGTPGGKAADLEGSRTPTAGHDHANDPGSVNP